MSVNHEAVAACGLNGGAQANKSLTRAMAVKRMPYVLTDGEDTRNIVAFDTATGVGILDFIALGRVFHYDSADGTTAHDGTTCLVSNEGRRYKLASGSAVEISAVLSFTLTAAPGSPAIGDKYLLPASCTGAWAGHDGQAAAYTARGWEFVTVPIGRPVYVEDVLSFYHRNPGGVWMLGLGAQLLPANAVVPAALLNYGIGGIIKAINAVTNTPPGSPAVGDAYIIGPAPTGAWAGKALQIALRESASAWGYYVPVAGDEVYDIAAGTKKTYTGSAWGRTVLGLELISTHAAAGNATIDFTGLDDAYDTYILDIASAKPATDSVSAGLRVGTGGTPTWVTSGYEYAQHLIDTFGSGDSTLAATGADRILLGANGSSTGAGIAAGVGNAAGENYRCRIEFSNPEAADFIVFKFEGSYVNNFGRITAFSGSGMRSTAGAITAIRFLFGSDNISTGRFSLYGLRKS